MGSSLGSSDALGTTIEEMAVLRYIGLFYELWRRKLVAAISGRSEPPAADPGASSPVAGARPVGQ